MEQLALVAILLATGPLETTAALAQGADRDPREIVLTYDEGGGKDVILTADDDCSDGRALCVYRRWERDGETDASVGPITTVSKVWVARDVETAKAIFREQENIQKDFPEKAEPADGPFKFDLPWAPPAEEWTALSACPKDRCESQGRIDVHQRMIARKGSVVSLVYLFGRARTATPDLTVYFTTRMVERA